MKKINFYAGPAILPEEVLQQTQEALRNFAGTGLSILEISHRSKEFVSVMEQARALVKELMQLNGHQEVLFLPGGASSQFFMVPMNLLDEGETAAYFETGRWAHLAMEEAKNFGKVHIACSSKAENFNHIPEKYDVPQGTKYLHITSNNTVYGSQLHGWPDAPCPVVVDMSSDIFSRQIDFNRFGLIYAGVQKNMGAAGVTLVVVNKELLGKVKRKIPAMLNYLVHIEKENLHNTPAVFAVYISFLTLQWIKKQGLKTIEERNRRKAQKLYDAIDASALFEGTIAKKDQSLMNVCFRFSEAAKKELPEEKFIAFAAEHGIVGIKGHKSTGGFRASLYNAMPESGVAVLIEVMREFERRTRPS